MPNMTEEQLLLSARIWESRARALESQGNQVGALSAENLADGYRAMARDLRNG